MQAIALELVSVVLQIGSDGQPPVGPGVGTAVSLGGSAVGAFLTTLLVGGILVALAPGYTERLMEFVADEPVKSGIYGIVALVALVLLVVVLALTIIGILIAVPLAILAGIIWAVGASIGFLAIGERLVGREDGWLKPLLVGAAINGGLALTGIGGLVSFAVGAAGFGAVLVDWRR